MKSSLQSHVDDCTSCQDLFAIMLEGSAAERGPDVDVLGSGPRSSRRGTDIKELAAGSTLGRYRIRAVVGAGAMGIVYLADDPSLHRAVAIKVLLNQKEEASARLLREAQALARISHPNVIVVHEVGTVDDQVFMAMEFVEGASLTTWLGERERSTTEILEHFTQAGRGLQVAHEAELVHRDFKPDNVLVGKDGRVRVVDFGLAREDVSLIAPGAFDENVDIGKLMTLTQTGAFMGTPAYMSPEQYEGRRADARSDQFGFAVSLFEALYGRRPHVAKALHELAAAILSGDIRVPPKTARRVPRHVRRALLRALSVDAAQRFPSMGALLEALARPAKQHARPFAIAAAIGLVLSVGAYLFLRPGTPPAVSKPVATEQPTVAATILPTPAIPSIATATPVVSPADTLVQTTHSTTARSKPAVSATASPTYHAPSARPGTGDLFDTVR